VDLISKRTCYMNEPLAKLYGVAGRERKRLSESVAGRPAERGGDISQGSHSADAVPIHADLTHSQGQVDLATCGMPRPAPAARRAADETKPAENGVN